MNMPNHIVISQINLLIISQITSLTPPVSASEDVVVLPQNFRVSVA